VASFAEVFAEMRETTNAALDLSQRSLKVLNRKALKCRVPYQTLIRSVVDKYAEGMEKTV